jgi:hypothetical protein
MNDDTLELQQKIIDLAKSTEAPKESYLMRRLFLDDPEQVQSVIDGLTLSLISYCYHRHPRGENVHELMELLDKVEPGSQEAQDLEHRADEAAAMQIPFIVTLNRLVEEYYDLRKQLEAKLQGAR